MNVFEMVLGIVIVGSIAQVLRSMFQRRAKPVRLADDPDAARMREEIRTLKDRVIVLERIATDKDHLLEQEFERLRDR